MFLDLSFLFFVFTRIVVVSVIEYAKLCIAIKGKAHVRIGFLGNLALEQFVQSVVVVVGENGKLVGKCHLDDIHYHVIGVVSVIILIVLFCFRAYVVAQIPEHISPFSINFFCKLLVYVCMF